MRTKINNPKTLVLIVTAGVLVCLLGTALGNRVAQGLRPTIPAATVLQTTESELDLGRVYETAALQHSFRITNHGAEPVRLGPFRITCDCLNITPNGTQSLDAGETRTFAATFSIVPKQDGMRSFHEQRFEIPFEVVYSGSDGRQHLAKWVFKGIAVPTMLLTPPAIKLGVQSSRQPAIEKRVDIDLGPDVTAVECESPSQWAVEIIRKDEGFLNRAQAIIRSKGPLTPRKVVDRIQFHPISRDERRLASKELLIAGYIVEDVIASPKEIQLGRRECGTIAEEAIRLDSLTGRSFSVQEVKSVSDNVEVTNGGDPLTYFLRIRIVAPGEQELGIKLVIQDRDGSKQELNVPIRYVGVES